MGRKTTRRGRSDLGSIEQLPSGRYRAYYRYEGRKFTGPHTFDSHAAAVAWLSTERSERARGTWKDPELGRVKLRDWATTWLNSRVNLADSTRRNHLHSLNRWVLPYLGDRDLGDLTAPMVRQWFTTVSADAHAAATQPRPSGHTTHGHPARQWAREHGYDVKPTGRLPRHVLAAWQAATQRPTETSAPGTNATRPGAVAACNAYRTLRACLNAAVRDGLMDSSPCKVEGAGQVKHPERIPATPDEVAALVELMPADLAAAVWVAAWSGLRYGELFALARKHVDLSRGTLTVHRTLTRARTFGAPKTASSVRTVWLPDFVTQALSRHMDQHTGPGPDALIFAAATGAPARQAHVNKHFRRAARAIGRDDLHWHDLRHTGATLAYTAGGTVRDVQRRLGHSTARAAMIYAHALDDGDRLLAERLQAAYAPRTVEPPEGPQPPSRACLLMREARG
ncbi:Tyrosine recombinase XerC [Tessaracoccus sp. O5.2]|uniref:tyrosine-type recombinase/integrase n=1 Tax=Tessaracoccus sp. O5.2 TaxID=3157622 RepID=UPI0035E4E2AB